MKIMICKNNIKNLILTNVLLFITIIIFLVTKNENIFFYSTLVFCFLTLIKCKISYFSIKTIIITYTLFPFYFKYNFSYSYGLFKWISNYNYLLAILIVLLYFVVWYIIYNYTNILQLEKNILKRQSFLSINTAKLFSFFSIGITLIRFPTLPFLKEYDRFTSLLPGNSWNHLAILLIALALPYIKKSHFIQCCFIFVLVWFLGHYERVDCIGLICLLFIINLSNSKITYKKIIRITLVLITVFLSFTIIEMVRQKNRIDLSIIPKKVLVHSTASDVAYTYGRSLIYNKNNGNLYGKTYLKYFVEIIPMKEYNYSSSNIINNNYHTVGGEFILNEPYMNFGLSGIILFIIIEFLFILIIWHLSCNYSLCSYYVFVFSVFRIVWYGISYIETTLIIYVPFILFINYLIKKRSDFFAKSKHYYT